MYNQQRFDNTVWDEKAVVSESVIWNQHIDKSQANWMQTYFTSRAIMDEIAYLDIGIVYPKPYSSFEL
jgi:hypothetical protein